MGVVPVVTTPIPRAAVAAILSQFEERLEVFASASLKGILERGDQPVHRTIARCSLPIVRGIRADHQTGELSGDEALAHLLSFLYRLRHRELELDRVTPERDGAKIRVRMIANSWAEKMIYELSPRQRIPATPPEQHDIGAWELRWSAGPTLGLAYVSCALRDEISDLLPGDVLLASYNGCSRWQLVSSSIAGQGRFVFRVKAL
jgi:hypothetical protein